MIIPTTALHQVLEYIIIREKFKNNLKHFIIIYRLYVSSYTYFKIKSTY